MRSDDLPAVVKLFEVHRAVSHIVWVEFGKEADHQVSAIAKSGFTWIRMGWMNPIALRDPGTNAPVPMITQS
jgi:hypothetical protein